MSWKIDDFPFIYGICNANFLHCFDLYGKLVAPATKTINSSFVSTDYLNAGVYFVEIHTDAGVVVKKVHVLNN